MTNSKQTLSGIVEGDLDEAVMRKILAVLDIAVGTIYVKNGKAGIRQRILGYVQASVQIPMFVLVDLDHEKDCAPDLVRGWLGMDNPSPLLFRVAVREVESWLLADSQNLAPFLGVREALIPRDPDREEDPKRTMVRLAQKSRRRNVREDMCPRDASGAPVGPAYTSRLIEFTQSHWRPTEAKDRSDSLRRCMDRLAACKSSFHIPASEL